jgi:hypothetical protein
MSQYWTDAPLVIVGLFLISMFIVYLINKN